MDAFELEVMALRAEHEDVGLDDPMLRLTEVAEKHGVDIDVAMKLFVSGGVDHNQTSETVH